MSEWKDTARALRDCEKLKNQLVDALKSALPIVAAQVMLMADKKGALAYEIPAGALEAIKAALLAAGVS